MNKTEFIKRVRATQVKCEICGHEDYALSEHLLSVHDMDPVQYRELHERARLASPVVAELLAQLHRSAQSGTLDEHLSMFDPFFDDNGSKLYELAEQYGLDYGSEFDHLIPEADEYYIFDTEALKVAGVAFSRGQNAFAGGPTGCGKSELFLQMYNRMRLPLVRVNMNGEVTPSDFIGSKELADDGSTYFRYGTLPYCMKHGIAMVLDEIDFTPPHVASLLFPVLEGRRTLVIPGTNEKVTAAPGFVVYATGNTGGKGDLDGVYTGTEVQNTAFLDRFAFKINMDYLPSEIETSMLMKRFPDLKKKTVERLVAFATDIREGFKTNQLSMPLSTRRLVNFFSEIPSLGAELAFQVMIKNWFEDTDLSVVDQFCDRNMIREVVSDPTKKGRKK